MQAGDGFGPLLPQHSDTHPGGALSVPREALRGSPRTGNERRKKSREAMAMVLSFPSQPSGWGGGQHSASFVFVSETFRHPQTKEERGRAGKHSSDLRPASGTASLQGANKRTQRGGRRRRGSPTHAAPRPEGAAGGGKGISGPGPSEWSPAPRSKAPPKQPEGAGAARCAAGGGKGISGPVSGPPHLEAT